MQPTPEFLAHATGFAGINGGNPSSPIWFCGIEYSTSEPDAHLDDPTTRMPQGAVFPSWTDEALAPKGGWEAATTWPFTQKMARIAMAFEMDAAPTLADVKHHIEHRMLRGAPVGTACQLNLYPVPFNRSEDAGFTQAHQALTGFPNKILYKAWCMEHRFPALRRLVHAYRPRVLVCTGTSFASDFRLAFLGPERVFEAGRALTQEHAAGSPALQQVQMHAICDHTLLAITPFLGQGGLMANDDLQQLGRRLRAHTDALRPVA